jgi:N-acylneuraminate cytidylyltransferase
VKPRVIAGIFARGGSKGAPRKNVREIAGKPLIAYAIEAAKASRLIDRVFVSTDDAEIADVARRHGADVPFMRPPELARDDSPEWQAWQHALRTLQEGADHPWDAFVAVPPTSPLRTTDDIDRCIEALLNSDADVAVCVSPAGRSPYFNMVTLNPQGYARLVLQPQVPLFRRQDAPAVYDLTTVAYASRPQFVLTASGVFQGRVVAVTIPPERAFDIDTELDFRLAEFLLQQARQPS